MGGENLPALHFLTAAGIAIFTSTKFERLGVEAGSCEMRQINSIDRVKKPGILGGGNRVINIIENLKALSRASRLVCLFFDRISAKEKRDGYWTYSHPLTYRTRVLTPIGDNRV